MINRMGESDEKKGLKKSCHDTRPQDQSGIPSNRAKGSCSQRDGPWECCGGVKPHHEHRGALRKGFPFPLNNLPFTLKFTTIVLLLS